MKKVIIASFLACMAVAAFSCKSTKRNNQTQQTNTEQRPNNREPNGQRRTATEIMNQMDTNKDGKISATEARGPLSKDFNTIDTNKDGFLNIQEINNAPKPPRNDQRGDRGNQAR